MPAHVQDLFVEVDLVGVRLLSHATSGPGRRTSCSRASLLVSVGAGRVDRSRHSNFLSLEGRFVGLEYHFCLLLGVGGIDHEIVVVASGHDILAISTEHHLKLVKDAVVFVRIAQTRAQVLVDWYRLDGLSFHVHVPDLDRQIISRKNVPAIMGEADVGNGGDDFGEK